MNAKPVLKPLQKLYKHNQIDLMLFSFVRGALKYIPSANIEDLIDGFFEEYGISDDDYPIESAKTTYFRIQKSFIEIKKGS